MPYTVYNRQGERKYLTSHEIDAFVKHANQCEVDVATFCSMIAFTGCRISEALAMTENSIDFEAEQVIIRCLKKRGKQVFRSVPLPHTLLRALKRWFRTRTNVSELLWPWSRMTGYRRICEVMVNAGVRGAYASPKGLRHGFGVRAIQSGVPLTLVQRWLGHADIKTTAIYTNAMGPEERELASRMWKRSPRQAGRFAVAESNAEQAIIDLCDHQNDAYSDATFKHDALNSAPLPSETLFSASIEADVTSDVEGAEPENTTDNLKFRMGYLLRDTLLAKLSRKFSL